MSELMQPEEIQLALKKVPEWEIDNNSITRTFEFDDFAESMEFVNNVAEIAEDAEHHPDIDIRWNKVTLTLSTHSKGGITENDFEVAARIDNLDE